jgi:hypothetical protein
VFDIGSTLRDARLRQDLDFPELEQITKIRPKYLRALEDERFDVLPAPTYVKGFLRSYADALGLDGQPFVDEYNSRFAVGEEEHTAIRTRRAPVRKPERRSRESHIAVLALLGIAIVTALVIAAWRFGGPGKQAVPGLAVQTQTPATTAQGRRHVTLLVRAVAGSSWMEVRAGTGSGRLLYSGTLVRGRHKRFQGTQLQLTIASPENVAIRLDGHRRQLPSGSTFVVTAHRIARAAS